jgi:hypothetical protein
MFLNVDDSIRELEPILILGDQIVIKKWNELVELKTDDLYKEITLHRPLNPLFVSLDNKYLPRSSHFLPIMFTTQSYFPDDGAKIAEDRFDILRAIINLAALSESVTFFRSEKKQDSIFLPTPVLGVFDTNGRLVQPRCLFDYFDRSDYAKTTLKDPWLSTSRRLLSLFKGELKSSSIEHHILGLLRLYQQAVDTTSPAPAFLAMWQVLESAVTFENEHINNQEINSRVDALLNLNPILKNSLKLFTNMRNDYVHDGIFDQDGFDLFPTLKLIAENCIFRMVELANQFSTINELHDYLIYNSLGETELNRRMKVIEFIKKIRAARS